MDDVIEGTYTCHGGVLCAIIALESLVLGVDVIDLGRCLLGLGSGAHLNNLLLVLGSLDSFSFSTFSCSGHLLTPGLGLSVALKQALSLIVDGGLDPRSSLDIVVVLEELVELLQALTKIVHADVAVLVKVEAQVIVLHEHLHVRVGGSHVGDKLILALRQHLDQHAHKLAGVVVEEHYLVLDLVEDLGAAALDSFELVDVIYVRIRQFVRLRLLHEAHSLATLVEPEVEQITCDDLQLLQRVHYCGLLLDLSGSHSVLLLFLGGS